MATELATAYVTLVPSLKGASKSIQSELSGIDVSGAGKTMGSNLGDSLSKGVQTASKAIITTIGAIGGAIGSLTATGGFSRALNLEQAQTMFKGLKLEWDDFSDTINSAVQGTAFGMDQAALVAANLAASGVSAGEQMEKALNGAVGASATFGADLGDIGGIFQKVAAQGKLMGDNLYQLSARGINATSILADYLGKTQAEVSEMVSAGQIDFETFSNAMYAAFGDSAKAANETFSGSMTNARAALSRLGQKFAEPILKNAPQVFVALKKIIDSLSKAINPVAERFASFAETLSNKVVRGLDVVNIVIKTFTSNIEKGMSISDAFKAAFDRLAQSFGPVQVVIAGVAGAIGTLGAAFGVLSTATAAIPGLSSLSGVIGGMAGGGGVFGLASKAITAFTGPAGIAIAIITTLAAGFAQLMATNEGFRNTVMGAVSAIVEGLTPAFTSLTELMAPLQVLWQSILNLIQLLVPVILNLVAALTPIISTLVSSLVPVLSTLIEIIASLVNKIAEFLAPIIQHITDLIITNMPLIQSIIEGVMQIVQAIIETVWPIIEERITSAMNHIQAVIDAVWPYIQGVVEGVLKVIQGIINVVMGIINGDWEQVWQGICDFVTGIWEAISNYIGGLINGIFATISGVLDNIVNIWNSIWAAVFNTVSEIWNNVTSAVSEGVDSVISFIQDIPGNILNIFANAGSLLLDSGRAIIDGLVQGIQGAIGGAMDAVGNALGAIRNLFPFSPAKEGPFSGKGWVLYSGISIMDALSEGAESQSKAVVSKFSSMASEIHDAFSISDSIGADTDIESRYRTNLATAGDRTNSDSFDDLKNFISQSISAMSTPVDLYMDGRLVGSTIAEHVNESMATISARRARAY